MKHVFRATKIGWDRETVEISFDADEYSEEEAMAQFEEYQGETKRGYPYTGYEYDGEKYHDVTYLGEFEEDDVPETESDIFDALIKRLIK